MDEKQLIHLSTASQELGFSSPQCFRITRKFSGGQFQLHHINGTTMIAVDELLAWAERVVRPISAETLRRVRLHARPESEVRRG